MKRFIIILCLLFTSLIHSQSDSDKNQRYLEGKELELFKAKILGENKNLDKEKQTSSIIHLEGEELRKFKNKVLGHSSKTLTISEIKSKLLKGEELRRFKDKILNKDFKFQQ